MHMSRLGKKAIQIPAGTTVEFSQGTLTVKGKNGALTRTVRPIVAVEISGNEVTVTPVAKTRLAQALRGTYAAHVRNMINGVNELFKKVLVVEGVGYRVAVAGKELTLSLGFSHPVKVTIPEGINVTVEKNEITITGIDRDAVGQFAANIRALKKPEPYKGKGIRYSDEVVRRKQGKKAAA